MTDREKLSELLSPWLAHLSLCAANDLIAKGVTIPVRCKDCKHWLDYGVCNRHITYPAIWMEKNDFCSYGERKENG